MGEMEGGKGGSFFVLWKGGLESRKGRLRVSRVTCAECCGDSLFVFLVLLPCRSGVVLSWLVFRVFFCVCVCVFFLSPHLSW